MGPARTLLSLGATVVAVDLKVRNNLLTPSKQPINTCYGVRLEGKGRVVGRNNLLTPVNNLLTPEGKGRVVGRVVGVCSGEPGHTCDPRE